MGFVLCPVVKRFGEIKTQWDRLTAKKPDLAGDNFIGFGEKSSFSFVTQHGQEFFGVRKNEQWTQSTVL